jgi:nucleoprotein TPR
MLFFADFYCCI